MIYMRKQIAPSPNFTAPTIPHRRHFLAALYPGSAWPATTHLSPLSTPSLTPTFPSSEIPSNNTVYRTWTANFYNNQLFLFTVFMFGVHYVFYLEKYCKQ